MPVMVTVKRDEPFEKALRRFKKKYEKAGILKDVKKNSFYLKPSE
ncbi:30S ribosomal protein S21, partial [bacterium]|nr:30S ribosomal protein S21 [bacterium]